MFHTQNLKREDFKKAQWERKYGPQGPPLAFDTTKELAQLTRVAGDRARSSFAHHRSTLPGVPSRQERRSPSVHARGLSRQENPGYGQLPGTPRFARKISEEFKSQVVPAWAKGRPQFDHINPRDDGGVPPPSPRLYVPGLTEFPGPSHARRFFEKLPAPQRGNTPLLKHPLYPVAVPGDEAEVLMGNLHILDRHAALEHEKMGHNNINTLEYERKGRTPLSDQGKEFNNRHSRSHGDTGVFVFRPGVKKWVMPARTKPNSMHFRKWNDHVNSTWHHKVTTQS